MEDYSDKLYMHNFTWRVSDFFSVPENEFIDSPMFRCLNIDVFLRAYPRGTADHKDTCLVFLMTKFLRIAFMNIRLGEISFDPDEFFDMRDEGNSFPFLREYPNTKCVSFDSNLLLAENASSFVNNLLEVSCTIGACIDVTEEGKIAVLGNNWKLNSSQLKLGLLSRDLQKAFNNPRLADVTLKAGDDQFPAHKIILMSRSRVFEGMFDSDEYENKENVVDMLNARPSAVKAMLQYMYTGRIDELSTHQAIDLYSISDRYDLPELKAHCQNIILEDIDEENLCDVAILASLHCDEELKSAAKHILQKNLKQILKTEAWRQFAKENPTAYSELLESAILDEIDDESGARKDHFKHFMCDSLLTWDRALIG